MAQSEIQSPPTPALTSTRAEPLTGERKLRRISAWLLLFFLLQGELGAVWDREWHAYVGRDQFWTPPHTLIYSCVFFAGMIALAVVLLETYRYKRKKAGVDVTSTVSILRYFHAPLGFSVLGFGALLALCAAPLDNYWHELYGIDIALWAPFHMMGVTGGLIGILGMIYVFASEAAIQRAEGKNPRRYFGFTALELGGLMALASFLNFVLTGFLQFPLVTIGTIHISTYPLPLVMGGLFCMIGAIRFTHRPGAATLLIFFLFLHTFLVELFIPWAIRTAVQQQGLEYLIPNHIPSFALDYACLPVVFLVAALIIDGVTYIRKRKSGSPVSSWKSVTLLGVIMAPTMFLTAPWILRAYSKYAPVFLPEPGVPIVPGEMTQAVIFGVIAALGAGGLGALLGADFGDIWRWNKR